MKKRYASQILRGATKKNVLLFAVAAFALCVSPAIAVAADCLATTIWTGSISNDWFTAGNWSNGVPNCSTEAQINIGTANINSTGASACTVTLGFDTADSGTLSVDGGNLSNCDDIFFVGNRGKGTLTITNGGTVTGSISASIASQSGQLWTSNGSVKVDGTNSTWTVSGEADVGGTTTSAGGTGLLTVTNGGTVSAGTSVHVWNSGTLTGNATVSVNSGSGTATVDGTLAPNWTLTTTGNLTFGNAAATMQCNVIPGNLGSVDAEVSGTATLTGIVSVTMTGTFTPGTRFTLLHTSGGRNGKFSSQSINFPTGQGFTPTITYDTNHVYLCLVPNTGGGCN